MRLRKIVNICIFAAVLLAWISMILSGGGALSEKGFGSLKFFTVLSNLLEGIASAIWLGAADKERPERQNAERIKFIAAASVALTFAVVIGFLGPLYGYSYMFNGANLFFHLLIPLAAVAEILFLSDAEYSAADNNLVILPVLIYGAIYLGNNIINGIGEWPDNNDWYGFLNWGYPVGIYIFVFIGIVTWLLGLFMRKAKRH